MSEQVATPASTEEVQELIIELEQYRERLVNELSQTAQKIKLSKKKAEKNLAQHPEIAQIDAALVQLRQRIGS